YDNIAIITYSLLWLVGGFGVLAMLVNPTWGPPLVFIAIQIGLAPVLPGLSITMAVLLVLYMLINLFLDSRRPRRWNPIGAGLMLGTPGMAGTGLLALGPLSIGALESQVPATLLAIGGQVTLIAGLSAVSAEPVQPLLIVIQAITMITGVLAVERLMDVEFLSDLNHKLRRLIFTVAMALLLGIGFYVLGGVAPGLSPVTALALSVISGAALVGAMGNRALYWRQFIERDDDDDEEALDEEVTGELTTQRMRRSK
ncbi:MAG: hypothetical protein GYB64_20715, partial [Chloroflexi bacterium]|nr:hypothetical protein [Chloroflexota bacterium]